MTLIIVSLVYVDFDLILVYVSSQFPIQFDALHRIRGDMIENPLKSHALHRILEVALSNSMQCMGLVRV